MEQVDAYAELLVDWQSRMNLVGPATLTDIWGRHFTDSAQVLAHLHPGSVVDLGTGAGFPGMVLAILGAGPVHLIEATKKKCAFLQAVVERLALTNVTIHNQRIEALEPFEASNITARACKNMTDLVTWALPFNTRETLWLLLKGATAAEEVAAAKTSFNFDAELIPSVTDADGRLVRVRNLRPIWNR